MRRVHSDIPLSARLNPKLAFEQAALQLGLKNLKKLKIKK